MYKKVYLTEQYFRHQMFRNKTEKYGLILIFIVIYDIISNINITIDCSVRYTLPNVVISYVK